MKRISWLLIAMILALSSCGDKNGSPDAYGNFEADEVLVSAEVPGKIISFGIHEGERLSKGMQVGLIDTTDLILKRKQLIAKRRAVATNEGGVIAEVAVLEEQLTSLDREMKRTKALVQKGAASQRQFDELESQYLVTKKKISAIRTKNANIFSEINVVDAQIEELDAQIQKCKLVNPIDGIVVAKYVSEAEVTGMGRPLYKIAELDTIYLRAYISGSQLGAVKLGQEVRVQYDNAEGGLASEAGIVTWVSQEAEFTPKIIQTRDDRVSLVYAVKIRVPNDGSLKIGMPGELFFSKESEEAK